MRALEPRVENNEMIISMPKALATGNIETATDLARDAVWNILAPTFQTNGTRVEFRLSPTNSALFFRR